MQIYKELTNVIHCQDWLLVCIGQNGSGLSSFFSDKENVSNTFEFLRLVLTSFHDIWCYRSWSNFSYISKFSDFSYALYKSHCCIRSRLNIHLWVWSLQIFSAIFAQAHTLLHMYMSMCGDCVIRLAWDSASLGTTHFFSEGAME